MNDGSGALVGVLEEDHRQIPRGTLAYDLPITESVEPLHVARTYELPWTVGALAHLQLGRRHAVLGDRARAKAAYQDFLAPWRTPTPMADPEPRLDGVRRKTALP